MKAQLEKEKVLIKAREIMQKPVLATTVRASVRDIASQLVANGFSGMPVADRDGTVVGVITEADIIKALVDERPLETLTAKDVMSANPTTVDVDTPIDEVMKVLQEHHILRVPVTDHGKLTGIVSRSDLIKAVLEPEFMAF
jgi:CBS domain-containing protein